MEEKPPHLKKKNSSGVALLLVLASLTILSAVVVEFAYNSNVTYNLAMNELDRTQAYYLALSGINFSKLVIKYDKEVKKVAEKASKKLGRNVQVPPLYEMIPINTELFRGLMGLGAELTQEGEVGEAEMENGESQEGGIQKTLNLLDMKGAKDFLAFKGDFSADITEQENKLNLNAFHKLNAKGKRYDRLKATLYHLLTMEEFEGLFEDRYRGAQELAQNIADFIDPNEDYNERGGEIRGREQGSRGQDFPMKNGKLLSLEELILVPRMTEEIFQKLKDYVTVYGPDEKIYLCRAEEELVKSIILAYTEFNPKIEALKADNTELLDKAVDTVLGACPKTADMAKALDPLLGLSEEEENTKSTPKTKQAKGKRPKRKTKTPTKQQSTGERFADGVKEKAVWFRVVATGRVGESEVKLTTVLDTSQGNARKWKELYWKVE